MLYLALESLILRGLFVNQSSSLGLEMGFILGLETETSLSAWFVSPSIGADVAASPFNSASAMEKPSGLHGHHAGLSAPFALLCISLWQQHEK
ncbi:hypothetical protein RIF29_28069 [Crotalaria pallida]|uniref:Uncharacterized protein n=1 Tax=Crotalaria pallida TaxID=3830 RepID=A0AAN9EV33_CROPI